MRIIALAVLAACTGSEPDDAPVGSGDTGGEPTGPVTCASSRISRANCVEVEGGDAQGLLDAANTIDDDTAIVLGDGTFALDNQVTLRIDQLTLIGQGMDLTTLDFSGVAAQANGVDIIGNDVHVEGFTVIDAVKDGIRIEESDGVVIRGVRATWTNEGLSTNGAYGIYPVRVSRVLLEDSEAYNSSDAGIYVGQCQHAIVRNNVAKGNVAGIEIENTQFADVYGNLAEDNTGGLVIFDLPGNPVVGRDIRIHDNRIINNNRENFASGGTVALIPVGTGTFALASRRVEIHDNVYRNNNTGDVALLSGLILEGESSWFLKEDELVGDVEGLELAKGKDGVANYRSYDIYVHDNSHSGSGDDIDFDPFDPVKEFGTLIWALYSGGREVADNLLYDSIGESSFSPTDASKHSNDNRICAGKGISLGIFDAEAVDEAVANGSPPEAKWDDLFLFTAEDTVAPYDCKGPEILAPVGVL